MYLDQCEGKCALFCPTPSRLFFTEKVSGLSVYLRRCITDASFDLRSVVVN